MFFTTGYASDMNMVDVGWKQRQNNPDLCDRGRRHRAVLTNGRFVITQGAIEGILHYVAANHVGKAGDGQTLPVPCFPENKE